MNKPQWLIDAENEIKNFEESKHGKMTKHQISSSINGVNRNNDKESQSNAAKKLIKTLKDNGTYKEKQSNAAKIANANPNRIIKFASLKTKENQSNASKAANTKNCMCPDGFITTPAYATKYCKKMGLDRTKCIKL